MDDAIRFLKAHKSQIKQALQKAFAWYKKRQSSQQQGGATGSGGYTAGAGAAGGYAGAAAAGNHQQQQPQQGYPSQGNQGYYNYQQHDYTQQAPQGGYAYPNQSHAGQGQSGLKPNHPNYNDNAVNSKNQRYMQLRSDARREGDAMAKCFDQSHKAYSGGDGGRAKQLSTEGQSHKAKMEQLNKEAADWIYQANNEDSGPDEVDLHGLYTQEAINKTENEIAERQRRGDRTVRVIVGKGNHSKDHVAHIKPAIENLMRQYGIQAHLDPHNSGVLVVDLTGKQGGQFTQNAAALTRSTGGQQDEDCVVM